MGTFLNLLQDDQCQYDVTGAMCDHFAKAHGANVLKTIPFGGLVTFLARKLCGFNGEGYHLPLADPVPLMDEPYFCSRLLWVKKDSHTRFRWTVESGHYIRMPLDYLPLIKPAAKVKYGAPRLTISFLIPKASDAGASSSAGPSQVQHEAPRGSTIPLPQPAPTSYNQTYNYGSFEPNSFHEQRHAWERVNDNLLHYQQYNALVDAGVVQPNDVHPTYWTGRDSFPGFVFDEYNVSQSDWGPNYHQQFGGGAGQFLPPNVNAPRGGGGRQSRGGRRRNDRSHGDGSSDLD